MVSLGRQELAMLLATAIAAPAGCGVPDVTFVPSDAGGGQVTDSGDAAPPGSDATPEAEASVSCPSPAPTGFTVCCESLSLWCGGQCTSADCAKCPAACASPQVCCIHGGGASCHNAPCP